MPPIVEVCLVCHCQKAGFGNRVDYEDDYDDNDDDDDDFDDNDDDGNDDEGNDDDYVRMSGTGCPHRVDIGGSPRPRSILYRPTICI